MGYGRVALSTTSRHRRGAAAIIAATTPLVLVPLVLTTVRVARDGALEYSARAIARGAVEGTDVGVVLVTATGGEVEVTLEGAAGDSLVARRTAERLAQQHPRSTIRVFLLEGVVIEIVPRGIDGEG
jgi:hypothetical protein